MRYGEVDIASICHTDSSKNAVCYKEAERKAYAASRAVLRIRKSGGIWCTAWLVGDEGHILTNWHCIKGHESMKLFEFEEMAEGGSCNSRFNHKTLTTRQRNLHTQSS